MYEGSKEEEYDELHEAERGSAAMVVHEVTYYIIHRFFLKKSCMRFMLTLLTQSMCKREEVPSLQ